MTFPDGGRERPLEARESHPENIQDVTPPSERVYAPASARVPREPIAGHRTFVEHPDAHTPEREAADEPSFTRVPRPSTTNGDDAAPAWQQAMSPDRIWMGMGLGWLMLIGGGLGVWMWARRRREHRKPINQLRRQARQKAHAIRGRMPARDAAARPAMGLTTALLPIALVIWRAQSRSRERQAVSDIDWQKRLLRLRERWTPRRVELEKFSLTRH